MAKKRESSVIYDIALLEVLSLVGVGSGAFDGDGRYFKYVLGVLRD